jgi:hypothetical protein
MPTRRRFFLAATLAVVSAGTFFAGTTRAGSIGRSRIEAQLGVRLGSTPPANATVGSTFAGVVVDPAKLSGKGFPGLRKNDKLVLKIVGPNNEFEIQHAGAPAGKRFKLNPQGIIQPADLAAAHAPVAAPAVKQ